VVTTVAPGVYRVEYGDGQSEVVYVAGTAGDLWAFSNGRVFRQREIAARAASRPTGTRAGSLPLVAPMPGTVLKVLVRPGDAVRAGDTIVILEAMKMELPLRALDGATVAAVQCREGELVLADTVLVTFEGV
jgi:biotin carboxyl carrier protein